MNTPNQIKGRLTSKKFIQWINSEFDKLLITEYRVVSVSRTRYTIDQYEGGASKLQVKFQSINNHSNYGYFLCFYFLSEYETYIKNGYRMVISFERRKISSLSNITVDLIKQ